MSKWSACLFVVLLTAIHFLDQQVDSSWQPISDFAIGPWGWIMKIAFASLGLSFLSLGMNAIASQKGILIKIGGTLLILAALGSFVGSVFDTDPAGTKPEAMTTSGQIHAAAAGLLGFMVLSTIFFTIHVVRTVTTNARWYLVAATSLLWVAEFVLIGVMATMLSKTDGQMGPDTPFGWHGRVVIFFCALWCVVCAMTLHESHQRDVAIHQIGNDNVR